MNIVQIDNWQDYLRDGKQFLSTASGAFDKKKKAFSPDTLYNLTCMAIEKLIMAFLMKNGDLAENHTMCDLAFALQRHLGEIPDLRKKLLYLDKFQEICDLETYTVKTPSDSDVVKFLDIAREIQELLHPDIGNNTSLPLTH